MKRSQIIKAFSQLGKLFLALGEQQAYHADLQLEEQEFEVLQILIRKQFHYNGWFTAENVQKSLIQLGLQLNTKSLEEWVSNYQFSESPKRVGIIMAGNIPLVGFHDFLTVLLSGNIAYCKLSSDDKTLLPALSKLLCAWEPLLSDRILFAEGPMKDLDAVIATGSDNSLKYFEQYFGKYPHVFRRNRTSVAVLTGNETPDQMEALGHDIFSYFGLGCRNVTHLIIPKNYVIDTFFNGIVKFGDIVNHHKYANNYDYQKAIHLMNREAILDNHFVLLKESEVLFSPLGMLHYHTYQNESEVQTYLQTHASDIQAVVGEQYIPFGQSQCPNLTDYADGIDTFEFLNQLVD